MINPAEKRIIVFFRGNAYIRAFPLFILRKVCRQTDSELVRQMVKGDGRNGDER